MDTQPWDLPPPPSFQPPTRQLPQSEAVWSLECGGTRQGVGPWKGSGDPDTGFSGRKIAKGGRRSQGIGAKQPSLLSAIYHPRARVSIRHLCSGAEQGEDASLLTSLTALLRETAGAGCPGIQEGLGSVLLFYPCLTKLCRVPRTIFHIYVLTTAPGDRSSHDNLPHITDTKAKGSETD